MKKQALDLRSADAANLLHHLKYVTALIGDNLYDRLLGLCLVPVIERLHKHSLYPKGITLKLSPTEAFALQLALLRWPWVGEDSVEATLFHIQTTLPPLAVRQPADLLPAGVVWEGEE